MVAQHRSLRHLFVEPLFHRGEILRTVRILAVNPDLRGQPGPVPARGRQQCRTKSDGSCTGCTPAITAMSPARTCAGTSRRICRDERFDRHRYNILDFSDATDFSPTEKELLINSGVLIRCGVHEPPGVDRCGRHAAEHQGSLGAFPCTWRVALCREDISHGGGSEEMDPGVRFHGGALQRRLIAQVRLRKLLIQ